MELITPKQRSFESYGSISYEERTRANTLIRFNKRILDFLPELRERKNLFYKVEFHWSYAKTLEAVAKAQADMKAIPLLLFIYGDTNETTENPRS